MPLDSLLRRAPVYVSGPTTAASSAVLSLLSIEVCVWFPTEAVFPAAAPSLHSFLVKSMRIDYFGGSCVVAAVAVVNSGSRGVPTLTSFANVLGHVRFLGSLSILQLVVGAVGSPSAGRQIFETFLPAPRRLCPLFSPRSLPHDPSFRVS